MVVSEFGAADPRTERAFDRITAVTDAKILLLVVDPASGPRDGEEASATGEASTEGAAA